MVSILILAIGVNALHDMYINMSRMNPVIRNKKGPSGPLFR